MTESDIMINYIEVSLKPHTINIFKCISYTQSFKYKYMISFVFSLILFIVKRTGTHKKTNQLYVHKDNGKLYLSIVYVCVYVIYIHTYI